jgi:recombination protein RecA
MFDDERAMTALSTDVTAALATLRTRWGAAAPQRMGERSGKIAGEVVGALATVPLPLPDLEAPLPRIAPHERVIPTGFAELDAILGPGGVPRSTSLALRGVDSSGRTTLALRLAAEAQSAGSIVAWVDLAHSFDPVEAVARGVTLDWLVVLTPESVDEGLAMAGSLLAGRTVDLLVVDLPGRSGPSQSAPSARSAPSAPFARSAAPIARSGSLADRLHRLAALARRAEALLVVLEPPGLASAVSNAVAEAAGLRLELACRSWIRQGRDVVGQRTEVTVARNRFGPPGRRAELRILYADGGERDACLRRDGLLDAHALSTDAPAPSTRTPDDATAPPLLAAPPPRSGPGPDGPGLRLVAGGPDRPRRAAVGGRDSRRPRPVGPGARSPAGNPARRRPPARPGGDVRRSGAGG